MSVFVSVLVSSIVKTTEPTLIKFAPNSYFWVIVLALVIILKFWKPTSILEKQAQNSL